MRKTSRCTDAAKWSGMAGDGCTEEGGGEEEGLEAEGGKNDKTMDGDNKVAQLAAERK